MALIWERLESRTDMVQTNSDGRKIRWVDHSPVHRAKVPGGWLVRMDYTHARSITFYPDPKHLWNGSSLR